MKVIKTVTAKLAKAPVAPSKTPTAQSLDPHTGMVKLFHHQGLRQSHNYQSGEVEYGVELFVENNPKAIAAGILHCEEIVENALGEKLPQMNALLHGLAVKNK